MATGMQARPAPSRPTTPHEPIGAFLQFVELECELDSASRTAKDADGRQADAIRSRMEVTWTRLTRDERRILIEV